MLRPFNNISPARKNNKKRKVAATQTTIWLFQKRLELIKKIMGMEFEVIAICDKCKFKLPTIDLLDEMKKKEDNFSILCEKCQHRFVAMLDVLIKKERLVLPLWRPSQILNKLGNYTSKTPEDILNESPAMYYSVIFHFGSWRNAFGNISIRYKNQRTTEDWKDIIKPFLGQISDYVIADTVGIDAKKIAEYRSDSYIEPFSVENLRSSFVKK